MATVMTPPVPTKTEARLETELRNAAGKIRLRDLITGALSLAALTLAYATLAIVIDQLLNLPAIVRQIGLAGFVGTFAALGWWLIVRPLTRAINPRFAARQVEATVPDAKNAVINWVDLKENQLPEAVRTAVGAQAAAGVAEADVNRVAESKLVLWLGSIVGLLVALLAVLFFVYKPAPFLSLVGRTFNPFSGIRIASRTEIVLVEPVGGDATITADEQFSILVNINGSIPKSNSAERVRLLVRHDNTVEEFEEIPFDEGSSRREFALKVPPSVSQNGFWYKVAAGDALTAEHRVTVRSRPMVKEFEVRYEYPAYTRLKPETASDTTIEAIRGTDVTLTVKTNRKVRRGWLQLDTKPDTIPAEIVPGEKTDSVAFRFKLAQSGTYRLGFTSTEEEVAEATPLYPVRVSIDQNPKPEILNPAADETTLPANGLLSVDGIIADDFGITAATLKLKVTSPNLLELQSKKYRDGASFRRETDGTFPTTLEYKDSISLKSVKHALTGQIVELKENMVLEVTLEATDNCTEPKANVGSVTKKIRLGPPVKEAEIQKNVDNRKNEEKNHQKIQDQKLNTEKRDPPKQPNPPKDNTEPMPGGTNDPMNKGATEPMPKGMNDPMPGGMPEAAPMPMPGGTNPDATKPDPNGLDEQAKKVQDALNEQNKQPAAAKPQPAQQPEMPPSEPNKPSPSEPMVEPKSGEKNAGSNDTKQAEPKSGPPMGQPESATGSEKPKPGEGSKTSDGRVEKPQPTPASETKPQPKEEPKPDSKPMPGGGSETPKPEDNPSNSKSGENAPMPGGKRPEDKGNEKPMPSAGGGSENQPKHDPKELEKAARDLTSDDPMKRQAARDKLDQTVGKQQREKYERIANDLKSDDPEKRKAAEEELGELSRETGRDSLPDPRKGKNEDVERLHRQADNLNSPDPEKRAEAEKEFDNKFGRDARENVQNGLKSNDPMKQEQARKDVDELAKKQKPKPPPTKQEIEDLANKAKDLASDDPNKKAAAEKEFDQKVGKDEREKIQKAMQDANAEDAKKEQKAANDLKQAAQQAGGMKPSKEDLEKLAEKAKNLNSNDPDKKAAAEKEFDEKFGKGTREQIQKEMKDAAGNPMKEQQAKEKLAEAAKQAGGGMKPTKEELEKLAEKAKDLNSNDPDKKAAAEKEFDEKFGKDMREQIQKDMKDLANADDKKKQDAKEKLEQVAKAMGHGQEPKPPTKEELDKLAEKAKDLNSDDPNKKAAAEKEFDEKFGKDKREQLQKDMKDMASNDPKAREDARKRLEEMAKNAGQPSKEDLQKLAEKAKDLASDDPAKREAAEKEFDQKFGKDMRQQMQDLSKDLQSNDPKRQQAARDKIDEQMKKWQPGGATARGPDGELLKDDPKNRLRTAELQLQQFEKNKHNKELQDKLGYSPEEFEKFLKGYRDRVAQLKEEVERSETAGPNTPTGPATLKVGEGSGNKKLDTRPDGTAAATGGSGPGTAPAGYSEAQRKFAEEAAKLRKPEAKK